MGQGNLTRDRSPQKSRLVASRLKPPTGMLQARGSGGAVVPDDHDDAIEDVVGVLDVAKGTVHEQLQQHLQGKEAGEDDVADFQGVGKLLGLEGRAGVKPRGLSLSPPPSPPKHESAGRGEQEQQAAGEGPGGSGCSDLGGGPSPKGPCGNELRDSRHMKPLATPPLPALGLRSRGLPHGSTHLLLGALRPSCPGLPGQLSGPRPAEQ